MTVIGQPERATQNRIIALFRDELGYRSSVIGATAIQAEVDAAGLDLKVSVEAA